MKNKIDNLSTIRKIAILISIALINFVYIIFGLYFYDNLEENISYIIAVSTFIFLLTMYLSINIYQNVRDLILNQQKVIDIKTEELKNINIKLEEKIAQEVAKNRAKDKIMFQHMRIIAMGEMISNIAHQWRQPLNAISVLIQGFEIKNMQGKLTNSFIEKQVKEGLKLSSELSRTLDNFDSFFIGEHTKDYLDLATIIKESIDFTQHHDIDINIDVEDIKIYCQKDDFSQIILNLFNNSVDKFYQIKYAYNKVVKIVAKQVENKITITYIDNAGGIDESIIDRIFEPYFTTKHKSRGTGVGLFMTKQIIEKQMQGRIWAENITININNKNYKCAKFEINLPLHIK